MASIEKRSDTSYRITVSTGYDTTGKKYANIKPLAYQTS